MSIYAAIDTGGTFTDLVMFDADSGDVSYTKSLTTRHNPIDGIMNCVEKVGLDLGEATLFKHGTTLVINTLLERSGPSIALVTTRGFRDILEFGRGNRTETFNLFFRRDPPLVPRELRFEIDERVDGTGKVLAAPDRNEVLALAERLRTLGVRAVAISFINSYLKPEHERQVAEWLRDALPACYVTSGVELTREWYEYERTATVAANGYTGPEVGAYIGSLDTALKTRGFAGQFLMMGSNGGVLSVQHSAAAPVLLVESGPVGGCIGAGAYGKALGFNRLIAFDMGGTTAKCAIVRDGSFSVESIYYAGGYGRGTPIRAPVVDIVEVGAGGGSIAFLDGQSRLNVGPRSAGSNPGPVAYGRGGTEPTVTDANLILGRVDPERFQGGEMRLDIKAARRAFAERLAKPLDYRGEPGMLALASGILSIAAVKMSEAIKRITVQRGLDPREFVLFAYGGGGPLHAVELARELSIPLVIIPPEAGNFSAIGMLLADIRRDESRTFVRRLDEDVIGEIDQAFAAMEEEMRQALGNDFGDVPVTFERAAEMRFVGQYHTVRIPMASNDMAALRRNFLDIYRARYGHAIERAAVEIVSLHSTAMAKTAQPDIAGLAGDLPDEPPHAPATRPVVFPGQQSAIATKAFARRNLPRGFVSQGPAVIEEYGSTTLIGPQDNFEIGPLGEIRITLGRGGERMSMAALAESSAVIIDPVKLEIIRTGIQSIPDLIETDLMRTAFSPLIYEYKDYAVGLISADGRALALATHGLPLFTSVMGRAILDGLEIYGLDRIEAGDAIITNYAGTLGQHLNNVVMYTPIFGTGGRPVAFMAVTIHWLDVGGRYPGSCLGTDMTDLFQEGLHLRSVKLYKRGELIEEVLRVVEYNTRLPDMLLGDIAAQYAGCVKGRKLFEELMARYGEGVLFAAIEAIWRNSEQAARAAVRAVPDGVYGARSFLDSDGIDLDRRIPVVIKVQINDGDFIVDFSECSDQVRGPFNSGRYGGAETCARIAFKYLFAPDDAPNEGGFAPVKVVIPDGKFLSATGNAPLGGYSTPLCTVVDTIIAAMAPVLPERTAAGHHSSFGVYGFSGKNPRNGQFFSWFDTAHGGWGGSIHGDGVGPYKTVTHSDTKDIPVETIEALYPMLVERYEWRQDTPGAGRHRGGPGLDKTIRVLTPCNFNASFERFNCPPWGLNGGLSGAPGYVEVETARGRQLMQKVSQFAVVPGDRIHIHTGSGGGFGPPTERDPEAVRLDVLREYESRQHAAEVYGVVLDADGHVDADATAKRRAILKASS